MPARNLRGEELRRAAEQYSEGLCAENDSYAKDLIKSLLHELKLEKRTVAAAEKALDAVVASREKKKC